MVDGESDTLIPAFTFTDAVAVALLELLSVTVTLTEYVPGDVNTIWSPELVHPCDGDAVQLYVKGATPYPSSTVAVTGLFTSTLTGEITIADDVKAPMTCTATGNENPYEPGLLVS